MRKLMGLCLVLLAVGCADQNTPSEPQQNLLSPCNLVPDAGTCKAYFKKYYFDKVEGKCKEFIWGGCGGVVPFNTLEECKSCEKTKN